MSRVDALRMLHQAATPPPWKPDGHNLIAKDGPRSWHSLLAADDGFRRGDDATLTAEARNALPGLLTFVELVRRLAVEANDGIDYCGLCGVFVGVGGCMCRAGVQIRALLRELDEGGG